MDMTEPPSRGPPVTRPCAFMPRPLPVFNYSQICARPGHQRPHPHPDGCPAVTRLSHLCSGPCLCCTRLQIARDLDINDRIHSVVSGARGGGEAEKKLLQVGGEGQQCVF